MIQHHLTFSKLGNGQVAFRTILTSLWVFPMFSRHHRKLVALSLRRWRAVVVSDHSSEGEATVVQEAVAEASVGRSLLCGRHSDPYGERHKQADPRDASLR